MSIVGLHHFAIPYPVAGDERAIAFYVGLLGLKQIPKPHELARDGGLWFQCPDGRHCHLQTTAPFAALIHPHPAFACSDLETMAAKIEAGGCTVHWDSRWEGVRRFYVSDPFGNRIEILAAEAVGL